MSIRSIENNEWAHITTGWDRAGWRVPICKTNQDCVNWSNREGGWTTHFKTCSLRYVPENRDWATDDGQRTGTCTHWEDFLRQGRYCTDRTDSRKDPKTANRKCPPLSSTLTGTTISGQCKGGTYGTCETGYFLRNTDTTPTKMWKCGKDHGRKRHACP